jgi:hypothetical protein
MSNIYADAVRRQLHDEADWEVAAKAILADLDDLDTAEWRGWLGYAIPCAVRLEATRMRMNETRRAVAAEQTAPERIIVRVPVDAARRVFRSMSLADCGRVELLALADVLEAQARRDLAKADAYRRLADALQRQRKRTVGQLAAGDIAAAFNVAEEEAVAA